MQHCSCPGSANAAELCLPSICADGDDNASTTSSVNDVPTDAELDRMIAAQQAQRLQQQRPQQPGRPAQQREADGGAVDGKELPTPQLAPPAAQPKPERRGKTVSWAEDTAAVAAVAQLAPTSSPPKAVPQGPPDLSGISLPGPALQQLQQEQEQEAAKAAAVEPSADGTEAFGSLPLTTVNVARLDERLTAAEQLAAVQAGGEPPSTEQVGWSLSLVGRAAVQARWAGVPCQLGMGQSEAVAAAACTAWPSTHFTWHATLLCRCSRRSSCWRTCRPACQTRWARFRMQC